MIQRGLVQARCPTCGEVTTSATALACATSEADEAALCELLCPSCDRALLIPVAPVEVPTLLLLGARKVHSLPFELLEAHSGPAVSWDEVLDLHVELENQPFPHERLGRAA